GPEPGSVEAGGLAGHQVSPLTSALCAAADPAAGASAIASAAAPGTGDAAVLALLVRRAMMAAATMKMLPASSPRWYPEVRATSWGACAASRLCVRLVAIADRMASPSALPSCWEALSRPAARPA